MINWIRQVFSYRVRALIRKEFNQIRRDRRLAISLIVPPTMQLLLFGFALSATVSNLRLGILDESSTTESRELAAAMSESKSFRLAGYYFSSSELGDAIARGDLDTGLVIPRDYNRDLQRGRTVTVQILLNAMNANTAAIAQGYAEGVIQTYNRELRAAGLQASFRQIAARNENHQVQTGQQGTPGQQGQEGSQGRQGQPSQQGPQGQPGRPGQRGGQPVQASQVMLRPAFLYNPGLVDSWFIVTGVFGLLLILNSSIVASGAMVKEREAGTIEQLLMSPASTSEIIIAKITPLFVLLCLMMLFAIIVIRVVFQVPFHGALPLMLGGGALCVLAGISIGTVIATFSKSAQQAMLTSFFVNPPLSTFSGALNPVEAMPKWLQPLTVLNPIHHFATIVRASMLKGSGLTTLWPHFLALLVITLVLFSLSVRRFRKQLS